MKKLLLIIVFILLSKSFAEDKWIKTNGPEGGFISGVTIKGDIILAGVGYWKGLIFYSFDGGLSWKQANFGVSDLYGGRVTDFVFAKDGSIIASLSINGLYKSTDFINWYKVNTINEDYWGLGADFFGNIYAGTDAGNIYFSSDNGNTWRLDGSIGLFSGRIDAFLLHSDSALYVGSNKKILKKRVNSTIWEILAPPIFYSDYYPFNNENILFASSYNHLYLSYDNGSNWVKCDTGSTLLGTFICRMIYNNRLIGACLFNEFQPGYGIILSDDVGLTWRYSNTGLPPKFSGCYKLAKSGNETFVSVLDAGIYKSSDYGESWSPSNNGLTAARILDIAIDKSENLYAVSYSNGIFISTDKGETWLRKENGLSNTLLLSVVVDTSNVVFAGTDEGIFRSGNGGNNWEKTTTVDNDIGYHLYVDKWNRLYAQIFGGGIYRSTDKGTSWQKIDNNFATQYTYGFLQDNLGYLFTGTRLGRIYRSTNDGLSWTLMRSTLSIDSSYVRSIVCSSDGIIYATNENEGLLKSTDHGFTWSIMNNGLTSIKVTALVINNKNQLYAATSDKKIFFSEDNGSSWTDVLSNLTLTEVNKMVVDKSDNLFLATVESVWKNKDTTTPVELLTFTAAVNKRDVHLRWSTSTEVNSKGFYIERNTYLKDWNQIAFIQGNGTTVQKVEYSYTDKNLTEGKYNYRLRQVDYNGSSRLYNLNGSIEITPFKYSLKQNYPNPFNPSTRIDFVLPESGMVKLSVFDALGQEVQTLLNEEMTSGNHSIDFNGNGLVSGVYFYKLQFGANLFIRKMILEK